MLLTLGRWDLYDVADLGQVGSVMLLNLGRWDLYDVADLGRWDL